MTLKYLLEKEFKQFFRNKFLPRLTIGYTIAIMLVMPWATTMDIKDMRVVVADLDKSAFSQRLISDIKGSPYFILEEVADRYDIALNAIEYEDVDAVVEIPRGFEKDLVTQKNAPVRIAVNTVNMVKGSLGASYLGNITENYIHELFSENPELIQGNIGSGIELVVQNRYNTLLNYKWYMIPALMVVLLVAMCGFIPALNIVNEKEKGTIEQMNVTPVSRTVFIMAKLIPYWVMGFVMITLSMLLAFLVYGLLPEGNVLTIYLFTLLFILSVSGLGLVVSNYSNTMQQAMFVMFFFVIVFLLMSGLFTPIGSMPQWAQWITVFTPIRYFVHMMRLVYLKGGGFADLHTEFFALLGFVIFFGLWAVLSYRKRQ